MASSHGLLLVLFSCLLMSAIASQKPIVRIRSCKYKTLLSLDGGVFRGVIQTQILASIEEAIKKRIVEKGCQYKSTSEFDILLSDYFDIIAGTSIGSYLTAYLVTNAADIPAKYPKQFTALPGSAAGAYQLFAILSETLASSHPNGNYSHDAPALHQAASATLASFYGNRSMHSYSDYATAGLFSWTRLGDQNMVYLFVDPKAKMGGYVRPADASVDEDEVRLGRNYYLWQAARGSGGYVPIIAPFNATTTPDTPAADKTSMLIVDGCFGAENPAGLALPHMLNIMRAPLKKIAVLSLGTVNYGTFTPYDTLVYGGNESIPAQWAMGWDVGGVANKFTITAGHRALFPAAPGKVSQYLRIDRQFEADKPCGLGTDAATCQLWKDAVLSSLPGPNGIHLDAFKQIGQALAALNKDKIQDWVNTYLL